MLLLAGSSSYRRLSRFLACKREKIVYQVTVRFAHCHLLALGACVQSRRVSDADVPVETQVPVDVQLPVGVQVPVLLLTGSSSSNWSKHRDNR